MKKKNFTSWLFFGIAILAIFAGAWKTSQGAEAFCDGNARIGVNFTNMENTEFFPDGTSTAMKVVAQDESSKEAVDMGTVTYGKSAYGVIDTKKSQITESGTVRFTLTWANHNGEIDTRKTATYGVTENCNPVKPTLVMSQNQICLDNALLGKKALAWSASGSILNGDGTEQISYQPTTPSGFWADDQTQVTVHADLLKNGNVLDSKDEIVIKNNSIVCDVVITTTPTTPPPTVTVVPPPGTPVPPPNVTFFCVTPNIWNLPIGWRGEQFGWEVLESKAEGLVFGPIDMQGAWSDQIIEFHYGDNIGRFVLKINVGIDGLWTGIDCTPVQDVPPVTPTPSPEPKWDCSSPMDSAIKCEESKQYRAKVGPLHLGADPGFSIVLPGLKIPDLVEIVQLVNGNYEFVAAPVTWTFENMLVGNWMPPSSLKIDSQIFLHVKWIGFERYESIPVTDEASTGYGYSESHILADGSLQVYPGDTHCSLVKSVGLHFGLKLEDMKGIDCAVVWRSAMGQRTGFIDQVYPAAAAKVQAAIEQAIA